MRSPDEFQVRLEGLFERLAPAREHYYRLVLALAESRWQERLRQELPFLRAVREAQDALEVLLPPALRRAEAEHWPSAHPTVSALWEVHSLREQLARDVARKLGRGAQEPLGSLLLALEDWLVTLPRDIPAHQREATAVELLPEALPALRDAARFAEGLEALCSLPSRLDGRLPFTERQREELSLGWARGEAALAALWRRLSGVDARGFLVAELRERATHPPLHPPDTGPARLVHAEYWYREALARLIHLARLRLAPLVPGPAECLTVMWWLFEREYAPHVRLLLPEASRAGLLELAYELWDAQRPDIPEDERWTAARWNRLELLARQAEEGRHGPEGERVRDALRGLIERHGSGIKPARVWWDPSSFSRLVLQARQVLGTPQPGGRVTPGRLGY